MTTNKTFRTQAIATLKALRSQGYTLTIKLNASNQALHDELKRIEAALLVEEQELQAQLTSLQTAKEPKAPEVQPKAVGAVKPKQPKPAAALFTLPIMAIVLLSLVAIKVWQCTAPIQTAKAIGGIWVDLCHIQMGRGINRATFLELA